MILGIGSDIVDIRRIETLLEQFGARFEEKLFTPMEIEYARAQPYPARTYAKRFAAREAFGKAMGTGMRGLNWHNIAVVRDEAGKPGFALSGNAEAVLAARIPPGKEGVVHLSLSDDPPYALAFVVIECR